MDKPLAKRPQETKCKAKLAQLTWVLHHGIVRGNVKSHELARTGDATAGNTADCVSDCRDYKFCLTQWRLEEHSRYSSIFKVWHATKRLWGSIDYRARERERELSIFVAVLKG